MKDTLYYGEEKSAAFIKADPMVLRYYSALFEIEPSIEEGKPVWNLVDLVEIKTHISHLKLHAYYDGTSNDEASLLRKFK